MRKDPEAVKERVCHHLCGKSENEGRARVELSHVACLALMTLSNGERQGQRGQGDVMGGGDSQAIVKTHLASIQCERMPSEI